MTEADIRAPSQAFAAAAGRAAKAGFRVLEIHAAHGYLIHSFLSPLANKRNDRYGGDLAGRMRFALEVAEAVREAWPQELPLFCRISAVDGRSGGLELEDSVALAKELKAAASMSSIARRAASPARRRSAPTTRATLEAAPTARRASRCPMPSASAATAASRRWPSASSSRASRPRRSCSKAAPTSSHSAAR